MNIYDFSKMKQAREKITVITCYDYTSARIAATTTVDCLLVGDSAAMTMHGHKDTLQATVEIMCLHTSAVSRGAGKKFIISDMPFLSFRKSLNHNVTAAGKLIQAGAHAIKLEGAVGNLKLIRHLTASGIPVMGHIGLTPQFVNIFGGYKVQGKTRKEAERLKQEALDLQEAGCFSLVLECVPAKLAAEISKSLSIPTIGIGAGADTDGQVLVFQDMLGLNLDFKPKFAKVFVDGSAEFAKGIEAYVAETRSGEFPKAEHSFETLEIKMGLGV
jgi:3-methyl-2-oxobutanoate hydroxymethyltransferase